ncbi:MAG: hypothetical protein V4461_15605 [Pseudomonadota bacterium]
MPNRYANVPETREIRHFQKLARALQYYWQPAKQTADRHEGQVSGRTPMFNIKQISQHLSVAICAVLFGSTMVLSAVGPARANETGAAIHSLASEQTPGTVRYLA